MRRILVQFARERNAAKRGGHDLRVSLSEVVNVKSKEETDLVALDDALNRLEKLDPRQARIVEIRFFGGLSLEEAAELCSYLPAPYAAISASPELGSASSWSLEVFEPFVESGFRRKGLTNAASITYKQLTSLWRGIGHFSPKPLVIIILANHCK